MLSYLMMSKKEKLLNRFLSIPKDFKYGDLKNLLSFLGYNEIKKGKTSGSRVAFVSKDNHIIQLHKPHPNPVLKRYQITDIIKILRTKGVIT